MLFADRMKVIIDVNVVISGLIAKKRGRDKAPPFMVLKQLESRMFTLVTNSYIVVEYDKKLNEKVREGLIDPEDCSKYMNLFRNEGIVDRMLITPVIYVVSDPSDNIYFQSGNCLDADFLGYHPECCVRMKSKKAWKRGLANVGV